MKIKILLFVLLFSVLSCEKKKEKHYPNTKKENVVDNYFNIKVQNPYRWLEDDNSKETKEWVKKENKITADYFEIIPFRKELKKELTKLNNYEKYNTPIKKNGKYYFFKNNGLQNQSVLYCQDSLEAKAQILLDPNTLSKDGTVSLSKISFSKDGKYLAYSIAKKGSDWNEIHVLNLLTKEKLPEQIEWVKFSEISWFKNGFYYSAYQKPEKEKEYSNKNEFHRIYYHTVGQSQSQDLLIYENQEFPLRNFNALVSDDERYIFLSGKESSSGNSLFFGSLRYPMVQFRTLVDSFDDNYSVVGSFDNKLYLISNWKAPKYRLLEVDLLSYILFPHSYTQENWKEIIPEKKQVLKNVSIIGGKLLATYLQNANDLTYAFDFSGNKLYEVKLPSLGSVSSFSGSNDENEAFYSFNSFTVPPTIFHFDAKTNTSKVFRKPKVSFKPEEYETKQVFYTSKDGTKIPMFLIHKKNLVKNAQTPTLLYGYGGFNISLTPFFKTAIIPFIENGGVYAVANLRGGGEYGKEWHKAGTKMKKQNVFNDFIAAAEYLIAEKYTNPTKLAINGASNGGLLVAACLTQRPDLFAVAVPEVGVLDMLRYHKFTIGWAWASDYGTSDDNKEMFEYLKAYSPLHNLYPGIEYPATLITTGDHDDRVVPAHSFKFAATMQEVSTGKKPHLIRVDTNAGHGTGKPIGKIIDAQTDVYSFIMYNLGMNPKFN